MSVEPMLFAPGELPLAPVPDWPFGDLEPGSFSFIMADPPWRFVTRSAKGITKKGAGGHYATMTLDEIKALPVARLAQPHCILWLWATAPMLPEALEVIEAWHFTYKTMGSWAKRTKTGKLRWGTGYRLRSTSEPYIIATRGEPKSSRGISSHIDGLARENSRKPEEAFAWAEKMMPDAVRLELFSRTDRRGWTASGDEAGLFNAKGKTDEQIDCLPQRERAGQRRVRDVEAGTGTDAAGADAIACAD